ncbi:MAG: LCP family protein [Mycobacterium sp.]|nr:LCP family protein [Mycobacterium sp.]
MSDGPDAPPDRGGGTERVGRAARRSSGNHTEGVAVADLIAKITGDQGINPRNRRSVEVTPPADDLTVPLPAGPLPAGPLPAGALPAGAIPDEIPDLEALARSRRPLAARSHPVPATGTPRTREAARRRRPALFAGRTAAALIAVCALALTGAAWQWQSAKNKLLNTIAALDPNSSDIRDPSAQTGDENFLIVGVDSRIGANAEMGAGDTDMVEGARADTIMLVNIPANRKRVVAVSFPRDLAITPMNCQAWNPETGRYGPVYDKNNDEWSDNERPTNTKLNSAYALGGPKCLVKVIQKLSGLAINRFIAVDFNGFSKMVDAVGGVEVCSTTPLEDAELGTVLAEAGRQKLDGHTALNYVRARSVTTEDNGDYGRIKRQQLFLSSLLRSMISSDTLFDLDRLNDVVNTFIEDSSVDNVQTRDLVWLGQSLQGINAGRITFVTIPTTGIADDEGNEVPRTEDVRALFDAIIDDEPLPGENDQNETVSPLTVATKSAGATPTSTTADSYADDVASGEMAAGEIAAETTMTEVVKAVAADPRDVTVQVSNPTEQAGLATAATEEFQTYRFDVRDPDYYSEWGPVSRTTVYYSLGNEQAAATVAATLPGARIERIEGLGELVEVVLGEEFTTVQYPQASGTALSVDVIYTGTSTPTQLPSDLTVTNGADISCE